MGKKFINSVKIKYPPSEKDLFELLEKNREIFIDRFSTIEKIILFGSYARGKPHFGSDVDLLFIVKERVEDDFEVIYESLFNLSDDYEWAPIIITESEFETLTEKNPHFFREIKNDGVILYSKKAGIC